VRVKLGLKPLQSGESERAKKQRLQEEEGHQANLAKEKEKETAVLAGAYTRSLQSST